MCDKCFANGELYKGSAEVGTTINYAETCYRCNGTGYVRPWGVCFACNGSKHHIKRRKIYTVEAIAKKQAAKAAKDLAKREAYANRVKDSKVASLAAVEGGSVALMKAQLILSTGSFANIPALSRRIDFLRSVVEGPHPWSEKRVELLIKTVNEFNALDVKIRDQKHNEEELRKDPRNWIHSGRYAIEGTVLSVKEKDTQFGYVLKMLVEDAKGRKFWSSVPKDISINEGDKGMEVTFVATVKPSDEDPIFGFCSRPTKGSILLNNEEAAA